MFEIDDDDDDDGHDDDDDNGIVTACFNWTVTKARKNRMLVILKNIYVKK